MRRFVQPCVYTVIIGACLIGSSARGQVVGELNPQRSNCCLANTARSLANQLQDWNQLGRYHQANDLKPAAMIVLADINVFSRYTGPSTAEMIEQNLMAMTELAQHHQISHLLLFTDGQ